MYIPARVLSDHHNIVLLLSMKYRYIIYYNTRLYCIQWINRPPPTLVMLYNTCGDYSVYNIYHITIITICLS